MDVNHLYVCNNGGYRIIKGKNCSQLPVLEKNTVIGSHEQTPCLAEVLIVATTRDIKERSSLLSLFLCNQ